MLEPEDMVPPQGKLQGCRKPLEVPISENWIVEAVDKFEKNKTNSKIKFLIKVPQKGFKTFNNSGCL